MKPHNYPRTWRFLRPIAYKLCATRDGELCADCHKRPVKPGQSISDTASQCKRLEVDHIDANKENNPLDGTNWQLLCHRCNSKKNPRGHEQQPRFNGIARLKLSREKQIENDEGGLKVYHMTMAKNLQAEPMFYEFIDATIKRLGSVKKRMLLDAAAQDFQQKTGNTISQQAISRYLDKRTNSINGDLIEFKDTEGDWTVRARL